MRKTGWIIAAAVLTAVGIGLFVFAVLFFKFDFKSGYPFISKEEMPTMKCVIAETPGAADRIEVRLNTSGLTLRPSEDGRCRAEYTELPDVKLSFTLENGTLRVVETDDRPWYRRLFWSPKQTVTLSLPPEHSYERLSVNGTTGDVSVDDSFRFGSVSVQVGTGDVRFGKTVSETSFEVSTTTGDIRIAGLNAGNVQLSVSTGEVKADSVVCEDAFLIRVSTGKTALSNVTCGSLQTEGSTGDVSLADTVASGSIEIQRSTGDIRFDRCDADRISVRTTTGDVAGTLRTGKTFVAKTSTGDLRIPESSTGGTCEITTTTGDVRIEIAGN